MRGRVTIVINFAIIVNYVVTEPQIQFVCNIFTKHNKLIYIYIYIFMYNIRKFYCDCNFHYNIRRLCNLITLEPNAATDDAILNAGIRNWRGF